MKREDGRSEAGAREPSVGRSISQKADNKMSPGCLAGFFGVFLLAGLAFSTFLLWPSVQVVLALSWTPTDCVVENAWVESHSGEDGATYSIEVDYRYVAYGKEYRGDRYEFMGGSSSGYDSKKEKVDRLNEAGSATCYFDPDDPSESVLQRGFSWIYLVGCFPLVFVAIGVIGILWALTSGRKKAAEARARSWPQEAESSVDTLHSAGSFRETDSWSAPVSDTGPVELEESLSPLGKLIALSFVALFWNGIVSVFLWQAWQSWKSDEGFEAGCLTLFMVPFTLVGLALLAGIPYLVLALANPRPKLTLSRGAVPLGGSAQLSWRFRGAAGRLRKLRIYLEGAEKARYRRGTKTHTDTEVFAEIDIVDRREGMPLASGSASIEVPDDTMHSFDGGHNEIVWKLKVHGEIPFWPDVFTEFDFVVRAEGD